MQIPTSEVIVTEMECPRPDGTVMLMRVASPKGDGPFPAVVDIHGGGWVMGDRNQNAIIDDYLAAHGVVAVAPEFRMPPAGAYPVSIADVHLAIRWLKANARALHSDPGLVGGVGTSSGGHQLLLTMLRPSDPRYGAQKVAKLDPFDVTLRYVVCGWPVADPLRRFRMAQEKNVKNLLDAHAAYWPSEAAMAEGNPQLIVENGLQEQLPPLLVLQGTNDDNLPPDMAARFVAAYRMAGGHAMLQEFEGQPHTFVTRNPGAEASQQALKLMAEFIHVQAVR
ncbi:MAG: alpha/beta hydrolase [Xanthobacteraceae bacterium]